MTQKLQQQTQAHYDKYPFIEGGPNRIAWWREYLRDFLPDALLQDRLVADIGSGIGEIARGLADRGARMVCLDISRQSLVRCREINPEADIYHGTSLDLPFMDGTFDCVISIGVLHHTPDCRKGFKEAARVLAPGGVFVVFLYNWWNMYNLIYHAFKPVRMLVPLERVPRFVVRLLQPFARTHLGQSLDDWQLRRLLGDKLWTPQATFHSIRQIRRWGEEEGLAMTAYKRFYLGYANIMKLVKKGSLEGSGRRQVRVRCTRCGGGPMGRYEGRSQCDCGHIYRLVEGIWECLPE